LNLRVHYGSVGLHTEREPDIHTAK
jgi:hypothetical protein